MKLFQTALALWCILALQQLQAQEDLRSSDLQIEDSTATKYKPFAFNLKAKNMHLWKGLRVTDAPVLDVDLNYTSRDGKFKAGLWGGAGVTGYYTEFDYYVSYSTNGFSLSVWDINNYSDFPDAGIFDYDRSTTSHFIDVTLGYEFKPIPLKLSWSTIVQGRDTYVASDGELKNAFSNYVEVSYGLIQKKDWSISAFVGGAFSFENEAHFYGDKPNLTNIGLIYAREVPVLKKFTIPMAATAMWNPEQEYGAIEVAITLF
ncbi:hypothetical protein [Leeuwenhoekiella sp. ZYFB001]|uniref:hypothetical protein n=1 Tax=Leeuwenhoekiella sp. ZYFB001 TaxID=2719912 RepID=UPI00142FA625|nr:hypothetical protein [Leeuwenhoekiella sp. ZYFB001]